MRGRYVQLVLTIAAVALGLAVVSIFASFDGVRLEQPGGQPNGQPNAEANGQSN